MKEILLCQSQIYMALYNISRFINKTKYLTAKWIYIIYIYIPESISEHGIRHFGFNEATDATTGNFCDGEDILHADPDGEDILHVDPDGEDILHAVPNSVPGNAGWLSFYKTKEINTYMYMNLKKPILKTFFLWNISILKVNIILNVLHAQIYL